MFSQRLLPHVTRPTTPAFQNGKVSSMYHVSRLRTRLNVPSIPTISSCRINGQCGDPAVCSPNLLLQKLWPLDLSHWSGCELHEVSCKSEPVLVDLVRRHALGFPLRLSSFHKLSFCYFEGHQAVSEKCNFHVGGHLHSTVHCVSVDRWILSVELPDLVQCLPDTHESCCVCRHFLK